MNDHKEELLKALEVMMKAKLKCVIICYDQNAGEFECITNMNIFKYTELLDHYVASLIDQCEDMSNDRFSLN